MESAERRSEAFPCVVDVALGRLAHETFELGENLFDRVEVRAVGRQEEQLGACRAYGVADELAIVAAEIVERDDVARGSASAREPARRRP